MTTDTQTEETVEEEGLFGTLTEEEKQKFVFATRQVASMESRVGRLEVQKSMMITHHYEAQGRADEVIKAAARRMGVPEGETFRLVGDKIMAEISPPG
jgi:hypothetical protein